MGHRRSGALYYLELNGNIRVDFKCWTWQSRQFCSNVSVTSSLNFEYPTPASTFWLSEIKHVPYVVLTYVCSLHRMFGPRLWPRRRQIINPTRFHGGLLHLAKKFPKISLWKFCCFLDKLARSRVFSVEVRKIANWKPKERCSEMPVQLKTSESLYFVVVNICILCCYRIFGSSSFVAV